VVESVQTGTSRPIRLVVGEGLPQIDADPDKFTQVITNLVENGIRHGEGTVAVSVVAVPDGATPAAASGIRIDVDDEGEGIPEQIRARVFTKFWKHGIRGGTGLGLYLVGGLTKAHGGTVMISDSPSGGARITVTWPAFNVD
jgi:signal transduction histidine kinase